MKISTFGRHANVIGSLQVSQNAGLQQMKSLDVIFHREPQIRSMLTRSQGHLHMKLLIVLNLACLQTRKTRFII